LENRNIPWIKVLVFLAFVAGLVLFLASIRDIVQIFIVSLILAYLLKPLAGWLEMKGLSRTIATSAIFIWLMLVLAAGAFLIMPVIAVEIQAIQSGFNAESVRLFLQELELWFESRFAIFGIQQLNVLENARQFVVMHLGDVVNYVPDIVSILVNTIFVPFTVFFLIRDGRSIRNKFIDWIPNSYFEYTLNVLHKMDRQLGSYLRGQVIDAFVIGFLSGVALWLLRVDYYVFIGVFAGLANLVPYVGPVFGGMLAVCVSLITGGDIVNGLSIIAVFVLIQFADNNLISRWIVVRDIKLHPLIILLVVIVGGKLFGFLGLFLAVPFTAIIKVILSETVSVLRRYRIV